MHLWAAPTYRWQHPPEMDWAPSIEQGCALAIKQCRQHNGGGNFVCCTSEANLRRAGVWPRVAAHLLCAVLRFVLLPPSPSVHPSPPRLDPPALPVQLPWAARR